MTDKTDTVTLTPQEQAARGLKRIVEEFDGAMKHGTWRDEHGVRLKDTPEWVALYNALSMPAPAQAWRDISTAPNEELVYVLGRHEDGSPWWNIGTRWDDEWDGGWCGKAVPTHWMPLPAPPAALIPDTEGAA